MNDVSTYSATALPQGLLASYPPCHAVPLGRMASIFGLTAWTVGSLSFAPDPKIALQRWARAVLRGLGVKLEVRGTLQASVPLWVSNHVSWLDPLVYLSLRPMGALTKSEVAHYPLIGRASRKAGLTFVDRLDATSRASAVVRLTAELRNGKPMLLFPEGTTTRGNRLAPLQEGGLRAAYRCGAVIQTLRLASEDPRYPWIGDDTLLPHLLKLAQAVTTQVHIEAGAVLEPRQFPCEDAWIEAIRQHLLPTA